MSLLRYHGQILEVTVIGCVNLKNLEWFTRQDPYVCVEYGSSRFRTRTCTDGGKNPKFQERFLISLIEGIQEMNLLVWNSNTFTSHDLIGSGKIQLDKLISQGIDDRSWTIFDQRNRAAGEVKLFMYCPSLNVSHQINYQPQGDASPSPWFPPLPLCSCHHSQWQQGACPGPSQTAHQTFCPHYRPFLHHSYSPVYPPQYQPSGSSDYPPGPFNGGYPPYR